MRFMEDLKLNEESLVPKFWKETKLLLLLFFFCYMEDLKQRDDIN